jgi:hypothetical protein
MFADLSDGPIYGRIPQPIDRRLGDMRSRIQGSGQEASGEMWLMLARGAFGGREVPQFAAERKRRDTPG